MILNNLNTLKIHKLTQKQYDDALAAGKLQDNEIYLTPVGITPITEGGTGANNTLDATTNLKAASLENSAMQTFTTNTIGISSGDALLSNYKGLGMFILRQFNPTADADAQLVLMSDSNGKASLNLYETLKDGQQNKYKIYGDHNIHDHANNNLNPHAIEFYGKKTATATEAINGGYIDFHFAEDHVSDYTSRIEEVESGTITIHTNLEVPGNITGTNVYGAVWNDYAEFRNTLEVKPGQCVAEVGNGDLYITQERLIPGCSIVSDTFGFAIGETETASTPLAVSGRVLAYTDADRYSFKAGDSVCSGPNGTVSKMTREEIREYPDCILGFVSEIPEYETWGSGNVEVDGRIWIKLR